MFLMQKCEKTSQFLSGALLQQGNVSTNRTRGYLYQGCKNFCLLTRPVGLVGGKKHSPL